MSTSIPNPSNNDEPVHLGTTSFSVSSRVALQLGRESISSSITAIVELVKNSYDADAEEIRVRFANLGSLDAFIVIEDTGDGMTVDDLKKNWMVIGTSNKLDRRRTAKERIVTGEKGLGRLGLDRLSSRTEVESIQQGSRTGVRLVVHWGLYEGANQRLESVEHDLYSISGLRLDPITGVVRDYPKGTRLILRGLKDLWDENDIGQLRNELALLLSPFQGPQDFSIHIDTGGLYKNLDGPVSIPQPLLDAANWKVVATLEEDGQMEIQMTSPRHEMGYFMKPTPWSEAIKRQGIQPLCGPLRMEFYFFVRRDAELATKTLRAGEIVAFLKYNQGIRLYRDGFRVKPYGEPDGTGDWLRLAYRRMQNPEGVAQKANPGSWRVGYNQVVGAVFLSHEKNEGLNDQTNREGLLQGKAFDHLSTFALRVIQFFEIHNQSFERGRRASQEPTEQAEEKARTSIDGANDALRKLSVLANQIPELSNPQTSGSTGRDSADRIKQAVGEIQRQLDVARVDLVQSTKLFRDAEDQKNTMANLASLGILAASFGHETLDWTGTVVKNANWLLVNLKKKILMVLPQDEDEITTALNDTAREAQKVRKFARFTLGNLNRSKREQKVFDLKNTVLIVFEAFDEVLKMQRHTSVDTETMPPTACEILGYEMDWESIVVNLITNASWALESKPAEERRIRISINDGISDWVLNFDDSGVGLEAGTEDMIFLPAFSTKRSARGEIIGTGMGLFIVKSFVEDHSHGTIRASAHGALGGASFEIRVPKAIATT
jgi:signal transduction histidine kinase